MDDGKIRERLDDNITRLIRISRQIREHQKAKTDAIAATYEPKDDEHQLLSDGFMAYLDCLLDKSKQQLPDGWMKRRMRVTMLMRWRRVSYYSAPLFRPESKVATLSEERSHDDLTPTPTQLPADTVEKFTHETVAATKYISEQKPGSTAFHSHAMTLSTMFRPVNKAKSVTSSKNLKSLVGVQHSDFPKPPISLLATAHDFVCPFCGDPQPLSTGETTNWRYVSTILFWHVH